MGIVSLGLEVIEIHFTPWDEFQAVDFLEVEAIEGVSVGLTPLDEFQAVDFWEVEIIEFFEIKDVVFTDLRPGGETLTHGSQRHHWGTSGP
jgi:hypothetical protein